MRPAFIALLPVLATASAQVSVLDSERLRIEQGKQIAAGKEMRVWHFDEFEEPMQDWPRDVRGVFVELRCEDNKFSEAALIVVRDDFRLRSYPAKSLTADDRAGWWKPIHSHAPRQYGVNIIELEPEAKTVEADVAGIVDETEGSDWRATLVAYDALGHARYSPTVHGGKVALDVRDGEKLALALRHAPKHRGAHRREVDEIPAAAKSAP